MSVSGVAGAGGGQAVREMRGMRGPRQLPDEAMSALAEKLGVSAEELKTTLDSADDPRKALEELAAEKGVSKEELRETIRAAMPAKPERGGEGGPPPPPPGGAGGVSFDDEVGQKLVAALAEAMDTSSEELQARLDGGESLKDMVEEAGLSHEDVRAAFDSAFKSWQGYGATGAASDSATPTYNAVDIQL